MFGVSTPTFVTRTTWEQRHPQYWSLGTRAMFHFANFRNPHILDSVAQLL
jgi:hypothetical protein